MGSLFHIERSIDGSWSKRAKVSSSSSADCRILVSSDGALHVITGQHNSLEKIREITLMYSHRPPSEGWSAPLVLDHQALGFRRWGFVVDLHDRVHLAHCSYGLQLKHRVGGGTNGFTETLLDEEGIDPERCDTDLAVDSSGVVHLVYAKDNRSLYYRRFVGDAWQPVEQIGQWNLPQDIDSNAIVFARDAEDVQLLFALEDSLLLLKRAEGAFDLTSAIALDTEHFVGAKHSHMSCGSICQILLGGRLSCEDGAAGSLGHPTTEA